MGEMQRVRQGVLVGIIMVLSTTALVACGGGSPAVDQTQPLIKVTDCGNPARKLLPTLRHELHEAAASGSPAKQQALTKRIEAGIVLCSTHLSLADLEKLEERVRERCDEWRDDKRAVMKNIAESGHSAVAIDRLPEFRILCDELE
jgi:hypothetical protein